jgi:2-polyprenyl-3-methyl-5-hydroxy-6-metoxy-1,4-benzoquinol methylase
MVLPAGSRRRALAVAAIRRVAPTARPKPPTPEQLAAREQAAAKRRRANEAAARHLRAEEAKLKKVWAGYRTENLEFYLVTGYQDPRINAQSILARHMLVRALFGSEFDDLMREELAHAVELNEAIRMRAAELGIALEISGPDALANKARVCEVIADRAPIFAERWRAALAGRVAPPLSVLEFACGSANDYRAFADYGIARFLDYTGIDLNETNIANAKRRFPDINFRVDSILSLPEADHSIDYVIGFDILEHLSLQAKRTAMDAAVRICRRGVYFAFFRMEETPEDILTPVRNYHSNTLSAPRMREYMSKRFSSMQLINVPEMLKTDFGAEHTDNPKAVTLIAEGLRGPG